MSIKFLLNLCFFGILVSFCASIINFSTIRITTTWINQLEKKFKIIIFFTAILIFFFSLIFWFQFDLLTFNQLKFNWNYHNLIFGLDGLSLVLFLLTTFISILVILVNWNLPKKFFSFMNIFILEFFVLVAFSTTDLFIFFLAFEGTLLPMLALLGIFGSRSRRIYALYSLFLYTIISSFFLLVAIFTILSETGSTSFEMLKYALFTPQKQNLIWICFFLAFATKLPLVPFHLWLPEAHVEAPTAGSILLASLLLKLGGYGFLRLMVIPFQETNFYFMPFIHAVGLTSLLYASLTALRQVDLKRIIAYSSIAHMSVAFLGIFSGNILGIQGGILMFLSHGLTSTALFFLAGILYSRFHSRNLWYFGGTITKMPLAGTFFFLFMCANCAVPGTFNFIAELFIFTSLFQNTPIIAFLGSFSFVFSAAYSIGTFNKIFFGSTNKDIVVDLTRREFFILLILLIFVLLFGFVTWLILTSLINIILC